MTVFLSLRSFKESSKNKNFTRTPSSKEHKKEEKLNISTPLQASIWKSRHWHVGIGMALALASASAFEYKDYISHRMNRL